MQEDVRAENGEHESQQNTGNDGGDFHRSNVERANRHFNYQELKRRIGNSLGEKAFLCIMPGRCDEE